jgi:bacillosamine biosynthesis N-acetyltransferase PglD-like protein
VITKIIILGAAGDGRVVADAVRQAQSCASPVELVGFLDDGRTTAVDDLSDACRYSGLATLRFIKWLIAALHKIKKMRARSQFSKSSRTALCRGRANVSGGSREVRNSAA